MTWIESSMIASEQTQKFPKIKAGMTTYRSNESSNDIKFKFIGLIVLSLLQS
jgi:hypothetical protein